MLDSVKFFNEINDEELNFAGGKGAMLARMSLMGLPVPNGFVVFPNAFQNEQLNHSAWTQIKKNLKEMRHQNASIKFAVRSSGLSEDSEEASFAGGFDTVLNMKTDEEIKNAIYKVFQSKSTKRITSYSEAKGFANDHTMAIVIQKMIKSEISGVLFTKDPVTANQAVMVGNFVHGLGERLVSGESNAYTFSFSRPKGKYEGPLEFRKFASKLFRYAYRLERMFGVAQDIEWALADGKIHLLQTRPITTLSAGNLDSYELNESLTGDFLWSKTNVGESMSEVVTPLTWSILRKLDESYNMLPGHYLLSGNVNGKIYSNISFPISIFATFGLNTKKVIHKMQNVFGEIPDETRIPIYPFRKLELIKIICSKLKVQFQMKKQAKKSLPYFIHNTSNWCAGMKQQIKSANTAKQLEMLWIDDLWQHNVEAMWIALEGTSDKMQKYVQLKEKVSQLVGDEAADLILSNHGTNDQQLASLGPLLGIADIIEGKLSKEKYIEQYGHRGPQEFELAQAEMDSDPKWLEQQIAQFQASHVNMNKLINNQKRIAKQAIQNLKVNYPRQFKRIEKAIQKWGDAPAIREATRSEWTRVFRVNRTFMVQVAQISGIGDDIFFLYIDEVLQVLRGDYSALHYIDKRKRNYNKYKQLPPMPSLISGRFDTQAWISSQNRRLDYYDALQSNQHFEQSSVKIKGIAGSAGYIEGVVRVLHSVEEGIHLKSGEILVTATTNIGWTPIFPKVAAIITDVGAPLSHAVIVARELGIPAVVGCGNATIFLKTGDHVVVDGINGYVYKK